MPAGIFEMRRVTCIWQTEVSDWELIPSRKYPLVCDGRLHFRQKIATRNIDRARRRTFPISPDENDILHVPSDGEDAPELSFGCLDASPDSDNVPSGLPGHSGADLGSRAPRRLGGNPEAPPFYRQTADSQEAQDEGDEEFRYFREFP